MIFLRRSLPCFTDKKSPRHDRRHQDASGVESWAETVPNAFRPPFPGGMLCPSRLDAWRE